MTQKICFFLSFVFSLSFLKAQTTDSVCGSSLHFNGSHIGVNLPSSNHYYTGTNGGYTWECWFKLDPGTFIGTRPLISSIDGVVFEDMYLGFGWDGGWYDVPVNKLVFKVDGPYSAAPMGPNCSYAPPGGFVNGVWYHAAGVMNYNTHRASLYVNGTRVDSVTMNYPPNPRIIQTQLCWDWTSYHRPLFGCMDEVRIWDRPRTASEIAATYNTCLTGTEPNLYVYYRCNSFGAPVVADQTPHLNHGTFISAALWSVDEPTLVGDCSTPCGTEICDNGIDDNGDGVIDEGCPEICGNGIDDNGDGVIDEGCPEICGNGIDDNGDGVIDENCPEICGNGIDDDNDGLTDENCVDCDTVVNPITGILPLNTTGCAPLSVTFAGNLVSGSASTNCGWNFGNGQTSNLCSPDPVVYTSPGCYDVTWVIATTDGCEFDSTFTGIVCVLPNPVADFNYTPLNPNIFYPQVDFHNLSQEAINYYWDFAGYGSSTLENPSFDFTASPAGEQLVCLTAVSEMGCAAEVCKPVMLYGEFLLYVPNAFTPDGDGINDVFLPSVQGVKNEGYDFYVFDRWGEMIFETHNPVRGWDGTFKNKPVKDDVYVWKIRAQLSDTYETREYTGTITLFR